MKRIKKIVSLVISRRFLSVVLMLFLLTFLIVGNSFIYNDDASLAGVVTNSGDNNNSDDSDKRPITSEEEQSSSSKNISGNLTEEYLHEHDFLFHFHTSFSSLSGIYYIDTHGFGDDHSRLHCPPPDLFM
jgi:hypothetical protein